MRFIELTVVFILIFQCMSFSQENLKEYFIKDSANISTPINKNDLQFKNFFRSDVNKRMGNDLMLGLQLYSKAINDSPIILQPFSIDLKDYTKADLKSFKESFSLLMELAKKDRNKYDLGFVTKYLGISQKVMAIILAIISVAK